VHSIKNEAPCNTRWFNYRASPAFLIIRRLVECFRNRYAISAHLMGIATFIDGGWALAAGWSREFGWGSHWHRAEIA